MVVTELILEDKINKFFFLLNKFTNNKAASILSVDEFKEESINQGILSLNIDDILLETKLEKIFLILLTKKLTTNPSLNHLFENTVENSFINQILTKVRLLELKSVKILRKGKTYYVNELAITYYGKMILKSIEGLSPKKKALTKSDYEKVVSQCEKIKLSLPETIEPTMTENFFNENEETEEN